MSKKKEKVSTIPVQLPEGIERVQVPAVEELEKNCKVGFYAERNIDRNFLDIQYRLRVEGLPAVPEENLEEVPDQTLIPWCDLKTFNALLQGAMYVQPLLLAVVKDRQKNAEPPKNS